MSSPLSPERIAEPRPLAQYQASEIDDSDIPAQAPADWGDAECSRFCHYSRPGRRSAWARM